MLELHNISKDYLSGDSTVRALCDVSIRFRKSEFVSILGPSGCGKTTLLNIIGGLDRYTEGDLVIGGVSTKKYRESDWDNYRNHSIGFVFQSYNLIPHQTVLSNVELALTLSGVSKAERRKRAAAVLEKVGLGDQLRKKPNQMSGGQMQRVAIARALVNDPEILLADEPTGALDSETSVQIMELLKEISKDRLIIMVTHNPDLAKQYSTRIVNLLDGKVVGDSRPCDEKEIEEENKQTQASGTGKKSKKPSMSLFTALSLSLNNLMTKKARTFLTSFAGSIGIIGIALILALSSGINIFINQKQEETLSSYPLSITSETADIGALLSSFAAVREEGGEKHENDGVYSSAMLYKLINTMNDQKVTNDLKAFKLFLDTELKEGSETGLDKYVTALKYEYRANINAYATDESGEYVKSDVMNLFRMMRQGGSGGDSGISAGSLGGSSSFRLWDQMLSPTDENSKQLVEQKLIDAYELLDGKWPESSDEVILILSRNNSLSDIVLYSIGLKSFDEMVSIMTAAAKGDPVSTEIKKWEYDQITGRTFKLILDSDYYKDTNNDGIFENVSGDRSLMNKIIGSGRTLRISGIVKPKEDSNFAIINGSIGFTEALAKEIINSTAESDVVKAQQSNQNYDVLSGLPFFLDTDIPESEKKEKFLSYCAELTNEQKKALYAKMLSALDEEEIARKADEYIKSFGSKEALIDSIILQYSEPLGIDFETFKQMYGKTFEELTDDQIKEMIMTYIKETSNSDEVLDSIVSTPTEDEINALILGGVAMIKQLSPVPLDDSAAKRQLIIQYYSQITDMSRDYLTTYAMGLDEEAVDPILRKIALAQYAANPLSEEQKNQKIAASFDEYLKGLDDNELIKAYDNFTEISESTLDTNLALLGYADPDDPSMINIYTYSFESKDKIASIISGYNDKVDEKHKISYTDYVALIMSSVTDIINAISYVLIAFVSISLVVSSIMIGIITYISVLERTKEIGILRSIGASKKDVSRVFNAETLIVGFGAGMIGIITTVLLCLPINAIIHALTDVYEINARLPWLGGIILVLISMGLTLIAGLIPSKLASKKDPVVALRTE